MGYVVKKVWDTKNGKTSVRLRADGTPYWQLVYDNRRKDRPADQPREQPIHRAQLGKLGIDDLLTFEQVKERCQHLNSKANLAKRDERIRVRAIVRERQDDLIESAFLPLPIARNFELKVLIQRLAGTSESAHYLRLLSHWKFVQRLIGELQIDPKDYAEESPRVYRYLERERVSPAYTVKIIRILNSWGQFYTKQMGGTGIEEVKPPRGKWRQDIARAYHEKKSYKGPADPLTPDELNAAQSALQDYNFNWLFLSIWLGLRPEEIDNLKSDKHFRLEKYSDGKTPVLWIFQTKLTSVTPEKAWKPIPLFHPDQQACVALVINGNFKRPLNKTLRKAFSDRRITAYSGRKGFTDLMQSLNQPLEEISLWLGHTSIETTWKHYKQKQVVRFNPHFRKAA